MDLLTDDYRFVGDSLRFTGERRIVEVLCEDDEYLSLHNCSMSTLDGRSLQTMAETFVEKSSILAVVPRDTQDLDARRRFFRTGLPLPNRVRVKATLAVGRLIIVGSLHLAGDGANPSLLLRHGITHTSLGRFFPVTDATLSLADVRLGEEKLLFVNRARVGATSLHLSES